MTSILRLLPIIGSFVAATAHAGSSPMPGTFRFNDGHRSDFHEVVVGDPATVDTIVFLYGGSGCTDIGHHDLPWIAGAMAIDARYLSLNKRHVRERENSGGSSEPCGREFNAHNIPRRWMADYMAFISHQLADDPGRWKNVVLVGTSEGAALAARVARARSDITHLIVIGDGGWSMRDNLNTIIGAEETEAGWREIAQDPDNYDKMWLGHSYRYWFEMFDRQPLVDYLALEIPVLIGIGERDRSVPAASAQGILRAAQAAGKRNIGVVLYPGADHSLRTEDRSYFEEFLRGAGRGIATGDLD